MSANPLSLTRVALLSLPPLGGGRGDRLDARPSPKGKRDGPKGERDGRRAVQARRQGEAVAPMEPVRSPIALP